MIPGTRVYYRMSFEDAKKVNTHRQRYLELKEMVVRHDQRTPEHLGAGRLLEMLALALVAPEGSVVLKDELFAADVARCYSAADRGYAQRDEPERKQPDLDFSGVADLRVLLPGNDTLFVPGAVEDQYPTALKVGKFGVTSLPKAGMFTRNVPYGLL